MRDPLVLAGLRARVWRSTLLELAAIAGVVLASHFIVVEHLRQNTVAGFSLTLVILALLVVLCFNTPRCFSSWRAYRGSQR